MWSLKIHGAAGSHEIFTCSTQTHTCLSHDGEFRVENSNHCGSAARPVYCKTASTGGGQAGKVTGVRQSQTQQLRKAF